MATYKIKEMNSEDRKKFIHCVKTNLDYDESMFLKTKKSIYHFPEFKMDGPSYRFRIESKRELVEFVEMSNGPDRPLHKIVFILNCYVICKSDFQYGIFGSINFDDTKYNDIDDLLNYFIDTTFTFSKNLNRMCDTKKIIQLN